MPAFHRMLPILVLTATICLSVGSAAAERNLIAYPTGQTVFHYAPDRYEILGPTSSKFNPAYSVAGQCLWDNLEQRVAVEVYRAPGLTAFTKSAQTHSEYEYMGSRGTVVVDGFSSSPRRLSNILVQFTPRPATSVSNIMVNGTHVEGLRYVVPFLEVSTPTGDGFYSDSATLNIEWTGPLEMEVIVYVDRNGNRVFDGERVFSILMRDSSVPTQSKTWGGIKALYGK